MAKNPDNPMNMIKDPFDGKSFVFPKTYCTDQRKLWFKRKNQIVTYLSISNLALRECSGRYNRILSQGKVNQNTPLKIEYVGGQGIILPAHLLIKACDVGTKILNNQVFIMIYCSLETYFFDLFERSFPKIGVDNKILDLSLDIMMRKKWDGKFCKMRDVFSLSFRSKDLMDHFNGFEMENDGKTFTNLLTFLDELTQLRHKIIHASNIIEKGKLIIINSQAFISFFAFCDHLTDYVDKLFSNRFGFQQTLINPAKA